MNEETKIPKVLTFPTAKEVCENISKNVDYLYFETLMYELKNKIIKKLKNVERNKDLPVKVYFNDLLWTEYRYRILSYQRQLKELGFECEIGDDNLAGIFWPKHQSYFLIWIKDKNV